MSTDLARQSALDPPKYRGVMHTWCLAASVPAGVALVIAAPDGRSRFAAAIFAFGIFSMFGASTLMHRTQFDDHAWHRFRRIDHMGIYLCIAGGYTPFGMLAADGWQQNLLLIGGWVGAAAGITMRFLPFKPPYGLMNTTFITLGWVAVLAGPELWRNLGAGWMIVTLIGGGFYTIGAFIVGARWPDPDPKTFGYHEIWHTMVLIAASLHYCVVAFGLLPLADA